MNAVLVSDPADGTLTLQNNGQFQYIPDINFSGADSFSYLVNDGLANSDTATVTFTVSAVQAPIVKNYTYNATAGQQLSVNGGQGLLGSTSKRGC